MLSILGGNSVFSVVKYSPPWLASVERVNTIRRRGVVLAVSSMLVVPMMINTLFVVYFSDRITDHGYCC